MYRHSFATKSPDFFATLVDPTAGFQYRPPQLSEIVLAAQLALAQNLLSSPKDRQPHDTYICLKIEHRQSSAQNITLSTTNTAHVPMSAQRLDIANLSNTNATHVPLCTQKPNAAN